MSRDAIDRLRHCVTIKWRKVEQVEQKHCDTTTPYRGVGCSDAEVTWLFKVAQIVEVNTTYMTHS